MTWIHFIWNLQNKSTGYFFSHFFKKRWSFVFQVVRGHIKWFGGPDLARGPCVWHPCSGRCSDTEDGPQVERPRRRPRGRRESGGRGSCSLIRKGGVFNAALRLAPPPNQRQHIKGPCCHCPTPVWPLSSPCGGSWWVSDALLSSCHVTSHGMWPPPPSPPPPQGLATLAQWMCCVQHVGFWEAFILDSHWGCQQNYTPVRGNGLNIWPPPGMEEKKGMKNTSQRKIWAKREKWNIGSFSVLCDSNSAR